MRETTHCRRCTLSCVLAAAAILLVACPSFAETPKKENGRRVVFSISIGGRTASMVFQALESGLVMWDAKMIQPPEVDNPPPPPAIEPVAPESPSPPPTPSDSQVVNPTEQKPEAEVSAQLPAAPAEESSTIASAQSDSQSADGQSSSSDVSNANSGSNSPVTLESSPFGSPSNEPSAPEWVDRALRNPKNTFPREGDYYFVAVDGMPSNSIEESRASIDDRIRSVAMNFLDQEFFKEPGRAEQISELSLQWMKTHWLVPGKEFDKLVRLPSGEYHQAWVQLKIPVRDQRVIEEWGSEIERQERVRALGGGTVIAVGGLGAIHLLLGIFVRRKKKGT